MVDVNLDLLASARRPVKNRAKVRFHTGTAEHLATVVLLDRDELKPADHAFVQLRFDTPIAVLRGDRYVVRSYSPIRTIGGGTILHPQPAKHKVGPKLRWLRPCRFCSKAKTPISSCGISNALPKRGCPSKNCRFAPRFRRAFRADSAALH